MPDNIVSFDPAFKQKEIEFTCDSCQYKQLVQKARNMFLNVEIAPKKRTIDTEKSNTAQCVLDSFNSVFGKKIESNKEYKKMIIARINDGYTLPDFEMVFRWIKWRHDTYGDNASGFNPMYFRISTLCRPKNFVEYLNGARQANAAYVANMESGNVC